MLQRAASNAYSWWWASHIRTKQSKWLDQSIQGTVVG
ncbi:Protein NETWORKED 2D [Mucuna pruriens]|uniref:Protein NETWORKED 2D n=1 Tax=Mucuna pruriens TaxID=157652 RepID=A0A371I5Y3_MUCPR|nr:Protein NETWORKED 2D [Mucuna pruriens]